MLALPAAVESVTAVVYPRAFEFFSVLQAFPTYFMIFNRA
jgi:hypothetical protein